jgi:hypothetical protein
MGQNKKKEAKKGASLLLETIVVAAMLLILFVVLIFVGVIKIGESGRFVSEYEVMAGCKNFYAKNPTGNQTIDSDPLYAPVCKPNQNQLCNAGNVCCDLFPDDMTKQTSKNFVGCCIPEEKKEKCPVKIA